MTEYEFERGYCERSGITIHEYHNEYNLRTLPCNCGDSSCEGWAAVINTPHFVKLHNDLYNNRVKLV
ncbi:MULTISPECIES: hypothetical protein [Bacillus]|uniref:hypothetical protein n=1 Tax=Bacillus TaxID=1386 RepID=UPI003D657C4B